MSRSRAEGLAIEREKYFQDFQAAQRRENSGGRLGDAAVYGAAFLGCVYAGSPRQKTMMMGDTVLLEDEVNPVMSAALDAGLEVTALHIHFFYDQPRVYFMHIGGTGGPDTLANGVKKQGRHRQMSVNTWAAFAGFDDEAVVDGDFVMRSGELQAVLKAMRAARNIVAIHQHMTEESPSIHFLHYWSKGKALDLAKAVKGVVDAQATASKNT